MIKITVEGKEVVGIVSYPEVLPPPAPELIAQRDGRRVTIATCEALATGRVATSGHGEAADLARSLWNDATSTEVSARWNGWQAAAWIATNKLAMVARLAGPIMFNGPAGRRLMLHTRTVEALLRAEIAHHCRCGAVPEGDCVCLDRAFATLNRALRSGVLFDVVSQSLDPVTAGTAGSVIFLAKDVQAEWPGPAGGTQSDAETTEVAGSEAADPEAKDGAATPIGAASEIFRERKLSMEEFIRTTIHNDVNAARAAYAEHIGPDEAYGLGESFEEMWFPIRNPQRLRGPVKGSKRGQPARRIG
jgi:hypothetical protein